MSRKFEKLLEDQKIVPFVLRHRYENCWKRTINSSSHLKKKDKRCNSYADNTPMPRNEKSRVGGWILGNTKIGPVLDVKVCPHQERSGIEIMIESTRESPTQDPSLSMFGQPDHRQLPTGTTEIPFTVNLSLLNVGREREREAPSPRV